MGNMMGCYRRSKTNDIVPDILSSSPSSGISGRDRSTNGKGYSESNTTSCSEKSGVSFGSQPSCGGDSLSTLEPLSGEIFDKPNLRVFTFGELKSATRSFRPETVLGEGGFGKVYKGWIDEKTLFGLGSSKSGSKIPVAIKKLNSESVQGFQEWQSEVNFLGRLSHPNLVKLLGYCWEDKELLLVYEYLPKGSLENHLFRRNHSMEPLSWERRTSIALGVAKGMAFLHSSDEQVIYRDFKTSNILLDTNYDAKISDFGLAKLGPSVGNSHVTTRVMGTYGYAAPEYIATGHLYVSSDVYGFGVVLLEMLTGLRALDTNRPSGQHNLVEWAKPCLSNKRRLKAIMDMRLEGQYSFKAAFELAQLILKCLVSDPKSRPSMKEIVEILEKIVAVEGKQKDIKRKNEKDSSDKRPVYYHPSLYRPQKLGQKMGVQS